MSDKIKVHVCPDCGLVMDLMGVTKTFNQLKFQYEMTKTYRCPECGKLDFEKEKIKK